MVRGKIIENAQRSDLPRLANGLLFFVAHAKSKVVIWRCNKMADHKVRIEKSKAKQGLDECIFELALTGKDMKDLQEQALYNAQGRIYGAVQAFHGKAIIALNLPRFIRNNNLMPFTLSESIYLEMIKNDCETQLKQIFSDNMNTEISRIEVNITQPISGNATQSDVLNLLSHATLSHEFDNVKYVGQNKKDMDSLKEENHTVITRRPHYWIGKFLWKTEQAINERIRNNLPTDDIPFGLLRIEIILLDRTLTKLFGNKKTLSDVLTAKKCLKFYESISVFFVMNWSKKQLSLI